MTTSQETLAKSQGGGWIKSPTTFCVVCQSDIVGKDYTDRHELPEGDCHEACCPCMEGMTNA